MEMNTKELLAALEGLEREKNIKRADNNRVLRGEQQ